MRVTHMINMHATLMFHMSVVLCLGQYVSIAYHDTNASKTLMFKVKVEFDVGKYSMGLLKLMTSPTMSELWS